MPGWNKTVNWNLLENWPLLENGEPEQPAFLKHCSSVDMDDVLTVNLLESFGIPCAGSYCENGALGKVILGMPGNGVDVFVPQSLLEEAKALLEGGQISDEDHEEI